MPTINLGTIGFTYRGVYDATLSYNKQDIVKQANDTYVSLVDGTTGVTPGTDATKWEIFTTGIGQNSGTNNGGIWYYDGANVAALSPGNAESVLRINNSGLPEWSLDDSRSGVRVSNLTCGRQNQSYRKHMVIMEGGTVSWWGDNGSYQHGTGNYTAAKSQPVQSAFPHGFVGAKEDTYQLTNCNPTTVTFAVTVANSVFELDAVAAAADTPMTKGNIYKFDQSDATNVGHQVVIEESTDGGTTWTAMASTGADIGDGETTSVYTTGTLGSAGASTYLRISQDETNSYRYVCQAHGAGMGATILLNTTGFMKIFRARGKYAWCNYGNAAGIIDKNSKVWQWGNNSNGVVGTGNTTNQFIPYNATDDNLNSIHNKTAKNFSSELAGESNNTMIYVLCTDGTVHHCGYSAHGQTGTGSAATNRFVQVVNATNVVQIEQSDDWAAFLIMLEKDGSLKHVGYGNENTNGAGNLNNNTVAGSVSLVTQKVAEILYVGSRMVWVRDIDGNTWNWGDDNYGFLARGGTAGAYNPAIVSTNNASGTNCITEVVGNPDHSQYEHIVARRADGTILTAGYNGYGQLGDGTQTQRTSFITASNSLTPYYTDDGWGATFPTNAKKLLNMGSNSYGTSGVLFDDGMVLLWGYNGNGQGGVGSTSNVLNSGKAMKQRIMKTVIDFAPMGYSSETGVSFLCEDGELYCVGYGGSSMMADDDAEASYTPKPILF